MGVRRLASANIILRDRDTLREVVGVVVVAKKGTSVDERLCNEIQYAQVPDVVPLLSLAIVDADTVVALRREGSANNSSRLANRCRNCHKFTHRSLLRALVRAAAGRAVDGVLGVVRVADRGGQGSEGHESGDGGEGAHYGRSKVAEGQSA